MAGTLRVLLVDDDDHYWELTQLALSRADLPEPKPQLVRVPDGPDALAYLEGHAEQLPHLLLVDQRMPRMDGTELLEALSADDRLRAIPVGFMSSSSRPNLVSEAYRKGASFFMVKPLRFAELTATLRDVFAFWAQVPELVG